MGELIFNAILAAVAVVLFALTYSFPTSIFDKSGGAGMYPRIVITILVILLIIRTIQILSSEEEKQRKFVFLEIFKGPRLVYFLVTLAYFLLVKYVGFILMTIAYLIFMILFFYRLQEEKNPSRKTISIVSVTVICGVILLNYVFCDVLGVLLPVGLIGF